MDWTSGAPSPVRWQVSDLCFAPEQPSQHLHEAVINSFPTAYTCKVTFLRSRQRLDCNEYIVRKVRLESPVFSCHVWKVLQCRYFYYYSTLLAQKLELATILSKLDQKQYYCDSLAPVF